MPRIPCLKRGSPSIADNSLGDRRADGRLPPSRDTALAPVCCLPSCLAAPAAAAQAAAQGRARGLLCVCCRRGSQRAAKAPFCCLERGLEQKLEQNPGPDRALFYGRQAPPAFSPHSPVFCGVSPTPIEATRQRSRPAVLFYIGTDLEQNPSSTHRWPAAHHYGVVGGAVSRQLQPAPWSSAFTCDRLVAHLQSMQVLR